MSDPAGVPPTGEARPPGMDHDLYPYRPAPEAPRFVWPGGARIALTVTVLLEYREIDPPRDLATILRAGQIRRANPGLVAAIQAELKAG